jgi:hypothetical protein
MGPASIPAGVALEPSDPSSTREGRACTAVCRTRSTIATFANQAPLRTSSFCDDAASASNRGEGSSASPRSSSLASSARSHALAASASTS